MKSYPATTHKDGQERMKDTRTKKEKEGCSCHWDLHGQLLVMLAYMLFLLLCSNTKAAHSSWLVLTPSMRHPKDTRVGILIVATVYLQLIQNRYMFRSFTVLQCSHQHCVQPVASDVEVVGYL